ncbi:hypothetical protein OROGR_024282 [Orobanche gracilis]
MGSREKDDLGRPHPVLSSLIIRPADSGGGGGGSDYEPGEVRRDPTPYSRGYKMRADSVSPVRLRRQRFSPGFEPSRCRDLADVREKSDRYRDYSTPYGRGRVSRGIGRGYDHLRAEGLPRNNPNVRPREGDWICLDPLCKNLNFARRNHCNKCHRPRYASSPRRGYLRVPPPLDRSPMNGGYRSPPRGWARDFRANAGPATRHEVRSPPDPPIVQDHLENGHPRSRYNFDRLDFRGRHNNYFNERRGYERRVDLSPSPTPRGWAFASHVRDRSRSPFRAGVQPKDYQRDMYLNRRRSDRPF